MATEFIDMMMVLSILANGKTTSNTVMALKLGQMVQSMRVITLAAKNKAKVFSLGQMDHIMMGNSIRIR